MASTSWDVLIDLETAEEAYATNRSVPATWFWDRDIYEFDLDAIFARSWHFAGPLCKLENSGDHIVADAGRIPVVVTRGQDGELRGFVNVCRHRGYAVALCDGNRSTLQCGYHAWTYDLDGKLRAASRCEGDPEFDKSEISLVPVAVDTWAGLVFVNPDPNASPLRVVYPELDAVTEQMEIDFAKYRYTGTSTYEVDANWKLWMENATECYHCATVHKGSFGAHYWDAPKKPIAFGEKVIAGLEPYHGRSTLLARHGIEPASAGQRYIYLWPSFIMGIEDFYAYPSTTIPLGPEKTKFVSHGFVNDDVATDEFREEWSAMYDQTFKEDVEVVAVQQRGLRSRKVPFGQLSPVADRMTRQFHRIILDAYQEAMGQS